MAQILCIDTSTPVCSVGLSRSGKTIAVCENHIDRSHASMLHVLVEQCLKEAQIEMKSLQAIAVSRGPGSYTGLRIGVSAAKGLSYALNIPLISVDTTEIMARMAILKPDYSIADNHLICPMIEARRDEVFAALYYADLSVFAPVSAIILNDDTFKELCATHRLFICGNGSEKAKQLLAGNNMVFIPDVYPSAGQMSEKAFDKFCNSMFEDTAYFEPYYLKDFVATTPKNKFFTDAIDNKGGVKS